MNMKALRFTVIALCAAVGAAAFAGCKKDGDVKSYYGKTVTFTGSDFRRGFEEKGAMDNYGDLGDTTYKKIAETYWNDIDWSESKPMSMFATPPVDVNALKTVADSFHPYEKWDGLSFTVTKEDTATVTLNLPSSFSGFGLGASVNMPLYEDNAELQADYSDIFASDLQAGYHGIGVKTDGDKRFVLEIWMSYSGGKDTVMFELRSENKNEYNTFYTVKKESTRDASIDLISKPKDNGGGNFSTEYVLNISYYTEVRIEDKK